MHRRLEYGQRHVELRRGFLIRGRRSGAGQEFDEHGPLRRAAAVALDRGHRRVHQQQRPLAVEGRRCRRADLGERRAVAQFIEAREGPPAAAFLRVLPVPLAIEDVHERAEEKAAEAPACLIGALPRARHEQLAEKVLREIRRRLLVETARPQMRANRRMIALAQLPQRRAPGRIAAERGDGEKAPMGRWKKHGETLF